MLRGPDAMWLRVRDAVFGHRLSWNVARVESHSDLLAPDHIELRVGQQPALSLSVPIFADPMILELWRVEKGSETAAG